jgi:DNA-binding NarL/FixJ family response regulator/signal transduction histidine kinase
VPATRGVRKRNLANVSDQIGPSTAASAAGSSLPTLAALRKTRASREALLRRILPIGLGAVVIVVVATSRAKPGAGLHGASLGVTLALAGFALAAIGGFAALLVYRSGAWLLVPVLILLMVSSSVLVWLQPDGAGPVGLLIAVGVAARIIPGRTSVVMLTACLGFLLVAESVSQNRQHRDTLELLVNALPLAAIYMIVLFGRRIRTQEAQTEQLLIELEESRGAELRAAALAERQRLARDMHDVLASPADERLAGTIDRAHELARNGLDEARRAIGMLRDDDLPGPDRLAALTAAFQADTGVPAWFSSSGTPRELASAVRLALYRVTQEALTNVRKHANPARLEVRLDYLPDEIHLAVEDYGLPPEGGPGGYGGGGQPPNAGGHREVVPRGKIWLDWHAGAGRVARRHPGRRADRHRLPGLAEGASRRPSGRRGMTAVRVLAADDQRVVREGLAMLLGLLPDVEVVGTAADGEEVLALAAELRPDVILMDLRMPRMDGVEATRRLRERDPAVKVVVLTTYADDRSVLDALRAGALGYLTKDAGAAEIQQALHRVAGGQAALDPAVQLHLVEAIADGPPSGPAPASLPDGLTPREAEVLTLIAAGLSNAEIAERLVVSEATVKSHVNHMLAKIGARDRAQAVGYAYRHGLVSR